MAKKVTLPVLRDIQKAAAKHGYKVDAGSFNSIISMGSADGKKHIGFDTCAAEAITETNVISLVLKQENKATNNVHWETKV